MMKINNCNQQLFFESSVFNPTYDADGNATSVQTSTGAWSITHNGENRPVRFESAETQTVVECGYDYIISASKMMAFLGKTFGTPVYIWKTVDKAREYRKCIENRNQTAFFADSGHVGMIRKGYQDFYFPQNSFGKIWVI